MLNKWRLEAYKSWDQLQGQLQENQRLRWMLWGIIYILVFYITLTLGEWRSDHKQNLTQLERTSAKLDQLQHQTHWAERGEQEKAIAEKWRAQLWVAQSESLAEADLQNYARRLMSDHNVQNLRLRLAPTEKVQIAGEDLIKVTVEVTGALGVADVDHLLKSMADNPKLLVVERFGYSPQRSGQVSLLLIAYFVGEAPSAESTGASNATR